MNMGKGGGTWVEHLKPLRRVLREECRLREACREQRVPLVHNDPLDSLIPPAAKGSAVLMQQRSDEQPGTACRTLGSSARASCAGQPRPFLCPHCRRPAP